MSAPRCVELLVTPAIARAGGPTTSRRSSSKATAKSAPSRM